MESEIKNLFKVWIIVFASLTFCHSIVRKIAKGKLRLISLLPIFSLFTLLPLKLSSIHAVGITTPFITWLANFKLLLFAFDQGPLSSDPPMSLLHFVSIACFPIKIKHDPCPQTPQNGLDAKNKEHPSHQTTKKGLKSPFNYAIKTLLLALVIHMYNYEQYMNHYMILVLYCCHIYFSAEIVLAMTAAPVRAILGLEIEPQFDEPYLSTSLQDFWSRRWNLMVPSILRPTIYEPIRHSFTPVVGRKWALVPAVMATFVVSGLMHELIYFYQSRVAPTWEVTCFFVLHGACLALEITVKKALAGRWQLHRVISMPFTIGFVAITGSWLFFPQMVRNGMFAGVLEEYGIFIEFAKDQMLKPLRLM